MTTRHDTAPHPYFTSIDYERRVFTNRHLDLADISLVGFDMDYTLAVYKETLKSLTTRLALRALHDGGYPASILDIEYDPRFPIRGLLLDTKTGNVVKRDAHQHVSRVTHGFSELSREERRRFYPRSAIRAGNARYVLIDTLFELPETYLYARLVQLEEREQGGALRQADYQRLYRDIRHAVDVAHRNGTLKSTITSNLDRYVLRDDGLAPTLAQLRSTGRRLFLLTNSEPEFTEAIMSYLLDGTDPDLPSWRDFFDAIVVFARKPGFFTGREPFIELAADGAEFGPAQSIQRGVMYRGGNLRDFERMVGVQGDAVLYVGDHIYGDVLRSKKTAAWRTAMIVPELERELRNLRLAMGALERRDRLERRRRALDDQRLWVRMRSQRLSRHAERNDALVAELEDTSARLRREVDGITVELKATQSGIDTLFNAYWGMLLKTGHEHSAFGAQIEDYACLYSSRVTNLGFYSPTEYFRTPRDLLPHEHFELFGLDEYRPGWIR